MRKFNPLIFHAQDFVNGTKAENGVLEKALRRGLVQILTVEKIIVNQLGRQSFRALLVVEPQMGQATGVIGQGAFCFAIDGKTPT